MEKFIPWPPSVADACMGGPLACIRTRHHSRPPKPQKGPRCAVWFVPSFGNRGSTPTPPQGLKENIQNGTKRTEKQAFFWGENFSGDLKIGEGGGRSL
eukprot:2281631-Amphidinium_carterae.1